MKKDFENLNEKLKHFDTLDMQFKLLESQKLSTVNFDAYKDDLKRKYASRAEFK